MARPNLVLYTRVGCHLCGEMKQVIETVAATIGLDLREVDIDTDPDLRRLYDWEVPVLEIDGRKAFKYRLTTRQLLRRLAGRTFF